MHQHTLEPAAQMLADVHRRAGMARDSSWFVFGDQDLIIPVALHRFMAQRAGAKVSRELAGGSHALSVSEPEAVAATILDAVVPA